MKTLAYILICLVAIGFVSSCNGNDSDGTAVGVEDTTMLTNAATADSIGDIFGYLKGYDDRVASGEVDQAFSTGYQRGLALAVNGAVNSDSYTSGVKLALDMLRQIKVMEQNGVKVNRQLIVEQFKKTLCADTVFESQIDSARTSYNDLFVRLVP